MRNLAAALLVLLCVLLIPAVAPADDLDSDTTWPDLRSDGRSLVFGRLQGRFDGPDFRGRKIRVRSVASGDESLIPVEDGLGYFEAVLPTGNYALVAIEATYIPPIRPMKPNRYPPVRQRYELKPTLPGGLPTFPVVTEQPLYIGTIQSSAAARGVVYEGHQLEVVDDFDNAWEHLRDVHPSLAASLTHVDVEPGRYFFLKPHATETTADLTASRDPLDQARIYIEERKFEQAVNWLRTFMPVSDREREEAGVLIGEALLADRKYDEAIEELGNVLLVQAENTRALRLLARAHAFEGDEQDALSLYRALAEFLPRDAEASLHLGYHYALLSKAHEAKAQFESAFQENFDYLLHDSTPYAMALRAAGAEYEPPHVIDGAVRAPSTLRSRRGTRGAFAMLLDHTGRVVAVHLTPDAGDWAPTMMMSVINARFTPAKLNGVSIPSLVILGADSRFQTIQ